jgi:serine protease AprX
MKGQNEQPIKRGRRLYAAVAALLLAVTAGSSLPAHASSQTSSHDAAGRKTAAASLPLGSMYNVVDQIGARALWDRGITGKGVNVALVDTGVAPVPALNDGSKVIATVDLSGEAGVPQATYLDTYGHGTFMAGIIAGRDPGANAADAQDHPDWFLGVAPDAGLVSVKVGDNTGAADISQIIAGVDWVVEHADTLDIGVLNLSYASGSTLPYNSDPLTFALERAWQAGIVVVVAAGNDGRGSHTLASPAVDPYVIAVAAVEAKKDPKFVVPSWMSSGDGVRNPDVSAPGAHIISLRDPLSRIDIEHPEGYVSDLLFKGSGSSQAAAVVAGAAALERQLHPDYTPDQIKAVLMSNTANASPRNARYSGAGVIQLDDSLGLPTPTLVQNFPKSDGTGSLEAARGPVHIVINGEPLYGEVTVLGTPWVGARWTGARWTDGTWDGARWTGGTWMGARWTDASWTGARWTGARWTGARWTDTFWNGARWTGLRWTGARWTADAWTGSSWTGARWTGARWTDAGWSGARWTGARWTYSSWDGARWTGARWTDAGWDGARWTGAGWEGARWTDAMWTALGWTAGGWE